MSNDKARRRGTEHIPTRIKATCPMHGRVVFFHEIGPDWWACQSFSECGANICSEDFLMFPESGRVRFDESLVRP